MKKYKLEIFSELQSGCEFDLDIQAKDDEEAIAKADNESDLYPVLICMNLYREDGSHVKYWGHERNRSWSLKRDLQEWRFRNSRGFINF